MLSTLRLIVRRFVLVLEGVCSGLVGSVPWRGAVILSKLGGFVQSKGGEKLVDTVHMKDEAILFGSARGKGVAKDRVVALATVVVKTCEVQYLVWESAEVSDWGSWVDWQEV